MTIQRVVTRSGEATVTGTGYRPEGELLAGDRPLAEGPLAEEVRAVLGGGSLANDAVLGEQDGRWTVQGDPTDAAFLVAERKLGITEQRRARFTRLGEVPFTSERKLRPPSRPTGPGRARWRWSPRAPRTCSWPGATANGSPRPRSR
jgi:magnesium-transporting ATPase (P-type)